MSLGKELRGTEHQRVSPPGLAHGMPTALTPTPRPVRWDQGPAVGQEDSASFLEQRPSVVSSVRTLGIQPQLQS